MDTGMAPLAPSTGSAVLEEKSHLVFQWVNYPKSAPVLMGINTIPKLGKGFVDAGRILLSYIKNQTLYHTLMTLIIPYIDDLTLADDLNLAWQILF